MRKSTVLIAAAVSLAGTQVIAAPKEIRLAGFTHEKSVAVVHVFKPFIEAVNKEVGDEVVIKGYWGGSLGRDPKKQYDLIKDGVADIAYFDPGYSPGRFPDVGLFELPFLTRSGFEASVAMWRMYKKGMFRGFDQVKALGLYSTDIYFINTKTPIDSPFDLKGMKVRSAAPVLADTIRALNGVPIGIPITQTTEAVSRGVVDGAHTGFSTLGVFRMLPVLKYHYVAPLGVVPLTSAMNMASWKSLSRRVQAAIEKHSGEVFSRHGGGGFDKVGMSIRKKAEKDPGHKVIELTMAQMEQGRKWAESLHRKWITENENGQAKYDALLAILADIRSGK